MLSFFQMVNTKQIFKILFKWTDLNRFRNKPYRIFGRILLKNRVLQFFNLMDSNFTLKMLPNKPVSKWTGFIGEIWCNVFENSCTYTFRVAELEFQHENSAKFTDFKINQFHYVSQIFSKKFALVLPFFQKLNIELIMKISYK